METGFIHAETGGRKIAYRVIGEGTPLILCNRFRGTMDTWDPLFLTALAENYKVITFEYTGIGASTGALPTDIVEVARDVKDLADHLSIDQAVVVGWSYGGFVAQAATFLYPGLVTRTVLLGTNPPGNNEYPFEQAFLDAALKPVNDFEDEIVLFFEPASEISRNAALASHQRIAPALDIARIPATPELFQRYFAGGNTFREDPLKFREQFATTKTPVLVICGDHDVSFPVENWFPMIHKISTAQLIIMPQTGHGPQHQHPLLVAEYIRAFIANA
ncbi:MAG: alpha/beta hydrolase [Chitinophagaceae bacterium]